MTKNVPGHYFTAGGALEGEWEKSKCSLWPIQWVIKVFKKEGEVD